MLGRSRTETGARMEPNLSTVQSKLTNAQWPLIADPFAGPKPDPRGGRPRLMYVAASKAFSECCGAVLAGRICRDRSLRT